MVSEIEKLKTEIDDARVQLITARKYIKRAEDFFDAIGVDWDLDIWTEMPQLRDLKLAHEECRRLGLL